MPHETRSPLTRQRGFALIAVMALGAVAMLSVTSLIGDGAVAERRAQDEELLKLRAYWAAQGHLGYAISRMRQGPPCGGTCNNAVGREDAFAGFFSELETGGGVRDWAYPEISSSYAFPVAASSDFTAPFVLARITYPAATTTHPLISQIWPARRNILASICSGVAAAGDPCPGTFQGLTKTSGISHIAHIQPTD